MNKKLYRDEYHKVLGGVCSGLAEYFEMDVTVLRLLFAFTVIIMGVGIIPYIVLWIVLPKKGYLYNPYNNPKVDYTVPPQQPDAQFTHEGNPFGGSPYVNEPFTNMPPPENMLPKQKSHAGIIIGMVLIIIGGAILVDEFDLLPDFDLERWWPVILVFIGAALIVAGQKKQPWHQPEWDVPAAEKENLTNEDNTTTL